MIGHLFTTLGLPLIFLVSGAGMAAYALAVFFNISTMGALLLIMSLILITHGATLLEKNVSRMSGGD